MIANYDKMLEVSVRERALFKGPLADCPLCGPTTIPGHKPIISRGITIPRLHRVVCQQCELSTKAVNTCKQAAALWGKRPKWSAIFAEVMQERKRQDAKWGGPAKDDTNTDQDWLNYVTDQIGDVKLSDREALIRVAALSVAAIESIGRKERQE
jgi:hypothetical protein